MFPLRTCSSILTPVLALACIAGSASGQTPQIASFKIESTVPVSGLQSAVTPAIPANVLASLAGGALEIREQITWSAPASSTGSPTLKVDGFLVAPGSPNPTPPAGQTVPILSYIVRIDQTIFSSKLTPSVTFIGTVLTNDVVSPFGNLIGATVIISTGYSGSSPVTFSNVLALIPGVGTIYSASAKGVLTLVGGPTTPPPSGTPGGTAPVAVAGPQGLQTTLPEVQLDASGSSDPGGNPLTFSWVSVGRPMNISDANTAKPRVQFLGQGSGDYTFEVTVSNNKGGSSTARVTVSYSGK